MSADANAMEDLYQQVILDHARDPHGRGLALAVAPATESHQVNPTCGDEVHLRVELGLSPDGQRVERVTWEGQGCSISQASLSVLTDLVTGERVADVERIGETFRDLMRSRGKGLDETALDTLGDAAAFTGVSRYPARIKCALLGWAALHDALVKAGAPTKEDDR